MVAVFDCLVNRFQQNCADALTGNITVAAFAECCASALSWGKFALWKHEELVWMDWYVYAAGNGCVTFAVLYALAGKMNCRKGRGAHCVNHHARSVKVAVIWNTVCNWRGCTVYSHHIALELFLSRIQLIFFVHGADIYAHVSFGRISGVACVLHCFIYALKEKPFLRLHKLCFTRRDVEE